MKIGLIGYGNIAKKHQAAIENLPDCSLEAIYDVVPITDIAIPSYTELSQFLEQDLDIVSVCSPNGLHRHHSIAALKAGSHVICEKPFALTSEDCAEMIEVAKQEGKKIFCTMQNRYSPVSQWLHELIANTSLGDIYLVNVACYWNRNKNYYKQSEWRGDMNKDGGTLFTQFSHYVDTIHWLFGGIKILNALLRNYDHGEMIDFEDTGIFNFELGNGGMGTFSYTTSCFEKNFESTLTLIGSKGTVKVAGQYMDRIEYCNIENTAATTLPINDNLANIGKVYKNAMNNILGVKSAMSTPEDGQKIVEIIEQVYAFKNEKI